MNRQRAPKLKIALLHWRYWPVWLGGALLFLLVQLPYPLICLLGRSVGRLSMYFTKRRVGITQRNLELCFPKLTKEQRNRMLIEVFESAGMGLLESGMAWFWPDKRVKKWCKLENHHLIPELQKKKKGILLINMHFFSLELCGRAFSIHHPGVGVVSYRPHNNPLVNWLQFHGRLKLNKRLLPRHDVRRMISSLLQGDVLWYAPDHDYGRRGSTFAPFFAVQQAATTMGTHFLARKADPAILILTPVRKADGSGYTLFLRPLQAELSSEEPEGAARIVNQAIELEILRAPGQYMWLHRRFKTRPEGEPYPYSQ